MLLRVEGQRGPRCVNSSVSFDTAVFSIPCLAPDLTRKSAQAVASFTRQAWVTVRESTSSEDPGYRKASVILS